MQRTAPAGSTLRCGLAFAGLASLAAITLVHPGATRMFATPWNFAHAATLLAPALILLVRALDFARPLVLPPLAWTGLALAFVALTLLSALTSPYRSSALLWTAPLLAAPAAFFVGYDWLHAVPERTPDNSHRLELSLLVSFALIGFISVGPWLVDLASGASLSGRNAYPLGHSNYTAGLALFALPLSVVACLRHRGTPRLLGVISSILALLMLFSSSSRGGVLGLAMLALAALWLAPFSRRRKLLLAAAAAIAGVVFIFAHPRTRAALDFSASSALAASDQQRTAMLTAAWRMGVDRPALGWGSGTTPLAYPRYRGGLAGGVENVLQLHSTPAQFWAELGLAGTAAFACFALLVLRERKHHAVAAVTLLGYGLFSFTDWQLDVPIFAAFTAALSALLARPPQPVPSHTRAPSPLRFSLVALILGALALIAILGRRDPAPELNVRALALAQSPANADRAIALLRESLALNPDQEIAHFNLGWLLVTRDPPTAQRHFLAAARLVPDKGGVYFGLGLARLNQRQPDLAARAFALECLNDPHFIFSPRWREPALAALKAETATAFRALVAALPSAPTPPPEHRARAAALEPDLLRLGEFVPGTERTFRRERTGYPVLMRNLDLPPPQDVFDVRTATPPQSALPTKGWLPAPVLLTLLDAPAPPAPSVVPPRKS